MPEPMTNPEVNNLNYKRLRTTGILNMVIGTLSFLASVSLLSTNLSYLIPATISAFTVITSLRAVLAPIPRTFGTFGVLFLAAGLWHIVVAVIHIGGANPLLIGALGVFQVLWSLQWFGQWRGRPRE